MYQIDNDLDRRDRTDWIDYDLDQIYRTDRSDKSYLDQMDRTDGSVRP